MSVSKWAYTPEVCDGEGCPGDCDLCNKPRDMEDEQLDTCPLYGGVCGYPSDRCYECPRHAANALAADVVEVVRCKDCKYWNHETDLTYCSKKTWLGTDATDYCSFGERVEV